jgi:hypothetical protein
MLAKAVYFSSPVEGEGKVIPVHNEVQCIEDILVLGRLEVLVHAS